jgi:ABC-type phosphate transport system substrate-binding protein
MRLWRWAGLLGALLLLGGCQRLVTPLERQLPPAAPASVTDAPVVSVAACWEAEPLAELLHTSFRVLEPASTVLVTLTHNEQALALLENQQATLGLVSTPRGIAPNLPPGWIARELAVDGLALVASPALGLASITARDLARLYGGYIVDWSELEAGAGEPLFVTRERGALLRQIFTDTIMGETPISSAAAVQPHTQAALSFIAETANALAYVPAAQVDSGVKVVALGDKLPTASQIERGGYPLTFSLWLVLPVESDGRADAGALRLASHALSSRGARAIERVYARP